jgi:hypothetical protein
MTTQLSPQPGRERRSSDPLAQLSRQLDRDCVRAVQPLELAAIMEAEGFNDAAVQERFGLPSVFAAAQQLYALVPHRPAVPAYAVPVQAGRWVDLLRGGLYLIPALWAPTALNVATTGVAGPFQGASLGLLTATLFGWGWTQGMSYLGYVGLVGGRAQAAHVLRWAGLFGTLLTVGLAGALSLTLGQPPRLVMLCALGIAAYLAAATTLLVLGEGRRLMLASLPALLWAALTLLWPDSLLASLGGSGALLVVGAGLPVLAAAGVTEALRHQARARATRRRLSPWTALPHAAYGWLCASALTLVLLEPLGRLSQRHSGLLAFSWTVIPLVLSMGPLEHTLRRMRLALTHEAETPRHIWQIVAGAWWATLRCAAPYLLGLSAVYAAVNRLAGRWTTVPPATLLAGHAALGAALLLSSLLINFGLLPRVLWVWVCAVAVQLLLIPSLGATPAYAASAALSALLLVWMTLRTLRDVRYLA